MISHLRYLKAVLRHKTFVFIAGRKLGLPVWQLLIHDLSKFGPAEWNPYRRRFAMGNAGKLDKTGDAEEFREAWLHHWTRNAHHWEYWVGPNEGGPWPMDEKYIREMVADWMGAGRAYTGTMDPRPWYEKNKDRMQLHPETRATVELLLESL